MHFNFQRICWIGWRSWQCTFTGITQFVTHSSVRRRRWGAAASLASSSASERHKSGSRHQRCNPGRASSRHSTPGLCVVFGVGVGGGAEGGTHGWFSWFMARTTPPFISLIHSSNVQPYGRETNNWHKYKKEKKEEKDSPTASILPQNIRIKHKYFTFTQSTVYAAYLTAEKQTTDKNGACAGESLQQNGGL